MIETELQEKGMSYIYFLILIFLEFLQGINFSLVVWTVTVTLCFCSILFIYKTYQKKLIAEQTQFQRYLLDTIVNIQENERKRFSEELHDDLGSTLFILKLKITVMNKDSFNLQLNEITHLVDEAINSTKRISSASSPVLLNKIGLQRALIEYCTQISINSIVDVKFYSQITPRFNSNIELNLYRVVQELINNFVNHGKASSIEIFFIMGTKVLEILLVDNGKTCSIKEIDKNKGLGLKNIESRLNRVNATLDYKIFERNITIINLNLNKNDFY